MAYYNARWYDAQVGVFISADTIVPSPLAPQSFNRYAYAGGNPLRYIDPTGHSVDCGLMDSSCRLGGGTSSGGGGTSIMAQQQTANPYSMPRSLLLPSNTPQWNAAPAGATDKASILKFRESAYLRPRLETWNGVADDAKVAEASGGLRRVRIWNGIFDWSKYDDYWEYVVDISAQYQIYKGGAECSQGKCVPAVGLDFEIVSAGLQPGNIMVGGKWGATGGAIGFDFFWGSNRFLIASPATILAEGTTALGQAFFGKDAQFLGVVETFNGMDGRSAMDKAQGFLNQYGFSYEVAR